MNPIDTLNIAQWHARFQQQTATLTHTRNLAFVEEALAALNRGKPDFSPFMSRLFELHAHLFVLELLLNRSPHPAANIGSFIGFQTHAAIADVQQMITDILQNKPLYISSSKSEWSSLKETLAYLRQHMLIETSSKSYFFQPYFQLLKYWASPHPGEENLYLHELEQLNAAPAALGSALSRYSWLLALAVVHFFLRNDVEARAKLMKIDNDLNLPPEEWLRLLAILALAEEWGRLSEWLMELTPIAEKLRLQNMEQFYQYWDIVIVHMPELEQRMWEPLMRSLPYSSAIYQQKLLLHGKWQQWIDYQLSKASEPLSFRVSVLAPIEKHDPALLLPYYHQAVERYILLKNRADYKSAVKLLKRLAKLYKKTKNEERWETFITAFASRNSRLRALQEELRKGKLIE